MEGKHQAWGVTGKSVTPGQSIACLFSRYQLIELNIADLDPEVNMLTLIAAERSGLVNFLKALTDERVRFHQAPFDHPEWVIPSGQSGNTLAVGEWYESC